MITEHTHAENNDWQKPDGEQPSLSEASAQLSTTEASSVTEKVGAREEAHTQTNLPAPALEDEVSPTDEKQNELVAVPDSAEQVAQSNLPEQPEEVVSSAHKIDAEQQFSSLLEDSQTSPVDEVASSLSSLTGEQMPFDEEVIRPFTDFIEEFRQTEERFSSLLQEPELSFPSVTAGSEMIQEPVIFAETAAEDLAQVIDVEPQAAATQSATEEAAPLASTQPPSSPVERPVSPLLRPATRVRLPRHSRHRGEEAAQPQPQPEEQPKPPVEETPKETPLEEQPARPARRYRFDRPAATPSASLPATKAAASPAPARSEERKEKRGSNLASTKEQSVNTERSGAGNGGVAEASTQKTSQETAAVTSEVNAPATPPASERRRRSSHERQREKEQAPSVPTQLVAPVPEQPAPVSEPMPVSEAELAVEDLPPLEYAELQAASSRRRRRRRAGSASTVAAINGAVPPKTTQPELPISTSPVSGLALPKSTQASYNIVSGYTVNQMNQGNEAGGPFMGPEPSPARGSSFGPAPVLRHGRGEALRSTPAHPMKPAEVPLMSAASVNYLATAVSQAIQTQTDRMVAELRRANQAPTNVAVSLPPFPSTERVGVFVDVANLLYSARTLRMTIDFGKLLDFLRGNRRLVRAQAYCPTSPQPGDDQMFLQAVKGLGYRITTKNYKTFSSGAKKADLDLDLCMDVVRLVDGRAVDCIVLVSGDSDFMPMLDYCSDHGVRVEVAAFDESMSATLRQSCDLFVNLSMLEEIRA